MAFHWIKRETGSGELFVGEHGKAGVQEFGRAAVGNNTFKSMSLPVFHFDRQQRRGPCWKHPSANSSPVLIGAGGVVIGVLDVTYSNASIDKHKVTFA